MTAASTIDDAPRGGRWMRTLLLIVVAAMGLDIVVGLGVWLTTQRSTLLPVLAIFLALSGIRLVGIAIDTIQRARARVGTGDASPLAYGYGWAAYRLAAAVVAFAGAAYLGFSPDARRLAFIDNSAEERAGGDRGGGESPVAPPAETSPAPAR